MKVFVAGMIGGAAAVLAIGGLVLGLFVGAVASANRPFRIHQSDVQCPWNDGSPRTIRCTVCGGRPKLVGYDPKTTLPITCPGCGLSGLMPATAVGRPVVVVADDEPTDYPAEAEK
jgi:hypothetical protein